MYLTLINRKYLVPVPGGEVLEKIRYRYNTGRVSVRGGGDCWTTQQPLLAKEIKIFSIFCCYFS